MSKNISNKEILRLWKDPLFSGAFRGIKTFQICLKLQKDIDISERRLYNVLKKEPIYLIHQKSPTNFKRRHLNLNNYGELVFGDIAYMYEYNDYKYFLLVVDGFSSKVFVRPLKQKTVQLLQEHWMIFLKSLMHKFMFLKLTEERNSKVLLKLFTKSIQLFIKKNLVLIKLL